MNKLAEEILKNTIDNGGDKTIKLVMLRTVEPLIIRAMEEYAKQFQQPNPVTMWDVNHMGARQFLVDFGIFVVMNDYFLENGNITETVDKYIEHKKKEK